MANARHKGDGEIPLDLDSIAPLYAPWDEPTAHRSRPAEPGQKAVIEPRRRPSKLRTVNTLRDLVRDWREGDYPGASRTTRTLLHYWFERSHRVPGRNGDVQFRYYFCQREAIETLIYLKEVRRTDRLSQILAEYGGPQEQVAALGVKDDDDRWARAAFKMATGSGKTKAMALCIAWSYFHALFESDSPMARHFVVIAPGLTVYERLKEDFGNGKIFDPPPKGDPIVPPEWRGDWNVSVVEQDAAGGSASRGVIYLTNIHRLYDPGKRRGKKEAEYPEFMGPSVSKANALDVSAHLRERISGHRNVMVLNDEAHHVWDPDSSWNEAIEALHDGCRRAGGSGVVHQLDFSATPKDDQGNLFRHVICDTPLGEAVDGGIVKFPIIGKASKLAEGPSHDAGYKYEMHLRLGYEKWKQSREQWAGTGEKALMFVMCESTNAADEITRRLNTDEEHFPLLKGRTINLHTNLKGRIVMKGSGEGRTPVFVEKDSEISDDDLRALRQLSRELDDGNSPYLCIVSVLMLREGWDVRNVTTIVPLRKYSAASNILAEQTLGRGLRRMTGPGSPSGPKEVVMVIDHPSFAALYTEELAQEGVIPEIIDADEQVKTTVDIFVDPKKNAEQLDLIIPRLSAGYSRKAEFTPPTMEEVRARFKGLDRLPLDSATERIIDFEGRSLTTGEILSRQKIEIPRMATGAIAISHYVALVESACKVGGLFRSIAGLMETFVEDVLFEEHVSLYDDRLATRLGDQDVITHVLHVFVPLVQARTIQAGPRTPEMSPIRVQDWKAFKASHSEKNPCRAAAKTLFNLVPCHGGFEAALAAFMDLKDSGVRAFAKNAGPQALRIDYVRANGQISTYVPDFIVSTDDGQYWLLETKGREDVDVSRKAKAAIAWCEAASEAGVRWRYVYVPQNASESMGGGSFADLVRACAPALQDLVHEASIQADAPLFADFASREASEALPALVREDVLARLAPEVRKAAEEAVLMLDFLSKREGVNLAPAFTALLGPMDNASKTMLVQRLGGLVPGLPADQKDWFNGGVKGTKAKSDDHYRRMLQNLRKTLLFGGGFMPAGLLRDCLDFALNDKATVQGVLEAVRRVFSYEGAQKLLDELSWVYEFRNTHVAHQQAGLTHPEAARAALSRWIELLAMLSGAVANPSIK